MLTTSERDPSNCVEGHEVEHPKFQSSYPYLSITDVGWESLIFKNCFNSFKVGATVIWHLYNYKLWIMLKR